VADEDASVLFDLPDEVDPFSPPRDCARRDATATIRAEFRYASLAERRGAVNEPKGYSDSNT